jgi:hypothetical protein
MTTATCFHFRGSCRGDGSVLKPSEHWGEEQEEGGEEEQQECLVEWRDAYAGGAGAEGGRGGWDNVGSDEDDDEDDDDEGDDGNSEDEEDESDDGAVIADGSRLHRHHRALLRRRLQHSLRCFTRKGHLLLCLSLLVNVPWVLFIVFVSARLVYHPS